MPRFIKPLLLSLLGIILLSLISCDKYNIVEPRFYDAGFVNEGETIFNDGIFKYGLPYACHVYFYLTGSAGNIAKVFVNEDQAAGYHEIIWNWRDDDGNKFPEGLYCITIIAGELSEIRCFEHHDLEDNLP